MAMSAKNSMLSPAAQTLGLGDQLKTQLDDLEEERKKKLLKQANQTAMGPATMSLFAGAGGYGA